MGILVKALALAIIPLAVWFFSGPRFDPDSVRSQRVLITGASTGIGEQLAYHYSKLGARVVITARSENELRAISKTCKKLGAQQVHFVVADMTHPEDRSKVIANVHVHLGGLDHLVLNHALLFNTWWTGSAENLTDLELVYRVNFLSYADLTSKALPMLEASRGRIGIMSSGFGVLGSVRFTVYSATKFALHGFFSTLRQELRLQDKGISVTIAVVGAVSSNSMLKFIDATYPHVPFTFMMTPSDTAQAFIQSVSLRQYWNCYDWKTHILVIFSTSFPQWAEDAFSSVLLNDDRNVFSKLLFIIWQIFYSG